MADASNIRQIQLPDGTRLDQPSQNTPLDVATLIGKRLAKETVAAIVNGSLVDATVPFHELTSDESITLRLVTKRDSEGLDVLRHSCAHLMARAVMRLYDGVQLGFGPTVSDGFYYDFDLDTLISEQDFGRIESEMRTILEQEEPFDRFTLSRDEALQLCQKSEQSLKVEHINSGLVDHDSLSFYRYGEFVDLCRGPHVSRSTHIGAFKILSVAAAYWKGDSTGKSLQRLYGTAWFEEKDLAQYLARIEEAKRRDHRVLGKRLGLFTIDPEVGQGLCLWLPKGATIRATLEEFIRGELLQRAYEPVYSPHIGRVEMYETSGHFPYYRDSQFAPIFGHSAGQLIDHWIRCLDPQDTDYKPPTPEQENQLLDAAIVLGFHVSEFPLGESCELKLTVLRGWQSQQERFLLKPMNCPHHVQMYKAIPRSYRDLPVRLAEFGTVYRLEQSGSLNGMLRVRGLTQDDAHIFCTPDQVENEFRETLDLVQFVLHAVGLNDYRVQLSTRAPDSNKYVGSDEDWQKAESSLRNVLTQAGLNFVEVPGEAAFYGPKADFMVKDCLGREWQLGTVQLDYNLPQRFELEYTGPDDKPHRPVMIHRAPFGSLERFVGILIEHFAGAFPLWLAPEQARIMPLSEKTEGYANEVASQLRHAGLRVTSDFRNERIQAKIRDAQLDLVPYMLVVGPRESQQNTASLRCRVQGDLGSMSLDDAIAKLLDERDRRLLCQASPS